MLSSDAGGEEGTLATETKKPVFETRAFKVWLGEDGITRTIVKPGVKVTLTDAKERIAAVSRCTGGRRLPVLADVRGIKGISREARQYMAGNEAVAATLAVGIIVGSPLSRVVASIMLGLNRTPFPIKLFTSEPAALDWLRSHTPRSDSEG